MECSIDELFAKPTLPGFKVECKLVPVHGDEVYWTDEIVELTIVQAFDESQLMLSHVSDPGSDSKLLWFKIEDKVFEKGRIEFDENKDNVVFAATPDHSALVPATGHLEISHYSPGKSMIAEFVLVFRRDQVLNTVTGRLNVNSAG